MPTEQSKVPDDVVRAAFDSWHLDRELALIEKQTRILAELLDSCQVTLPEGIFVIVPQARMKEIVETLDTNTGVMRLRLQKKIV